MGYILSYAKGGLTGLVSPFKQAYAWCASVPVLAANEIRLHPVHLEEPELVGFLSCNCYIAKGFRFLGVKAREDRGYSGVGSGDGYVGACRG